MSVEVYERQRIAGPVGLTGIKSMVERPLAERVPSERVRPDPYTQALSDQGLLDTDIDDHAGWGAPRAVAQLVAQYSRFIWCLLRRLGVRVAHIDDATQQVFIVAARRLDDVPEGRERAFLCGTAVRVASNYRRAENSQGARHTDSGTSLDDLQSSMPNSEHLMEQMQARRMLDRVLDNMTEELRTVFVLCEIEGMTAPEVAGIVDAPIGTVSSRLRRAREQFREQAARLREAFLSGEAV